MADPVCTDDAVVQIQRARARIASLETRASADAEYDHAVNLHRAGAALDNVLEAVGEHLVPEPGLRC